MLGASLRRRPAASDGGSCPKETKRSAKNGSSKHWSDKHGTVASDPLRGFIPNRCGRPRRHSPIALATTQGRKALFLPARRRPTSCGGPFSFPHADHTHTVRPLAAAGPFLAHTRITRTPRGQLPRGHQRSDAPSAATERPCAARLWESRRRHEQRVRRRVPAPPSDGRERERNLVERARPRSQGPMARMDGAERTLAPWWSERVRAAGGRGRERTARCEQLATEGARGRRRAHTRVLVERATVPAVLGAKAKPPRASARGGNAVERT